MASDDLEITPWCPRLKHKDGKGWTARRLEEVVRAVPSGPPPDDEGSGRFSKR
jgi:hypothetical protein